MSAWHVMSANLEAVRYSVREIGNDLSKPNHITLATISSCTPVFISPSYRWPNPIHLGNLASRYTPMQIAADAVR